MRLFYRWTSRWRWHERTGKKPSGDNNSEVEDINGVRINGVYYKWDEYIAWFQKNPNSSGDPAEKFIKKEHDDDANFMDPLNAEIDKVINNILNDNMGRDSNSSNSDDTMDRDL